MNLFDKFAQGLHYADFLSRYGTAAHQERWRAKLAEVKLLPEQKQLLASFTRKMPVLCLAGAWCGDCINQCPIFEHFVQASPLIDFRYLDRDAHADVQAALRVNGGDRVPVVVFFSEDGYEVSRYGDRTLSKYRSLMADLSGSACPTGLGTDPLLADVTRDWLGEFERVQAILRLSGRLRKLHND